MSNPLRRVPLLALALTCLAAGAQAQGAGSRIGVFGGVAMSKLHGGGLDDVESVSNRIGAHAGLFAELGLGRKVAIQPEVAYVMGGAKVSEGADEVDAQLNWIEVPVLLKLVFPPSGSGTVRPFLYAGPAVAFKMSCKFSGTIEGEPVDEDCEEFDTNLKGTNFSAVVGGGVDFGRLSLGARYALGLVDLNNEAGATSAGALKTRALSILVGYALRLNGR